jgi:hypothetical protein
MVLASLFFAGIFFAILGATVCRDSLAGTLLIYGGGAVIGFASSAFFSRPDQFLLRGITDPVYLVRNHFYSPYIYELADRETLNAFGGIWHEILNVSEKLVKRLCHWFGKGKSGLKDAKLYRVSNGEKSVFAVLLGVRYGVPGQETLEHIWGNQHTVHTVGISELDKWFPGGDLVSIHYWPEDDRDHV